MRDQVLSYIRENAPDDPSKTKLASWLLSHKNEVILEAKQVLAHSGCEADVNLSLSQTIFPQKYMEMPSFPAVIMTQPALP